jgi:hypothetical protein
MTSLPVSVATSCEGKLPVLLKPTMQTCFMHGGNLEIRTDDPLCVIRGESFSLAD